MRLIREAWRDVLTGVDVELYFVLVLTVGVLAEHVLGHFMLPELSVDIVVSANLIALTAIGIGLLKDRRERRLLQQSINRLESPPLGEALQPWGRYSDEFRVRLASATTFSLLVRTPQRTVQRYDMQIRQLLRLRDAHVRILAVNPESDAMRVLSKEDAQCSGLMRFFLEETWPQLLDASGSGDQIEVRVVDAVPSCLLALIDAERSNGVIYATIISAGQPRDVRPTLRVTPTDGRLYDFFQAEFNYLWRAGQEVARRDGDGQKIEPAQAAPATN